MDQLKIDFRPFQNELIIHFGVDNHEINAKTLAYSLISLTNSIKRTDAILNPGFEVEILVEAVGVGSFKVSSKKVYKGLSNIFSVENIKTIALSIIAALIWEFMKPEKEIKITVNSDEYILERGDEKIILPREAEKYYDSIKKNDNIKKEISDTFKILEKDVKVDNIGFDNSNKSKEPLFLIPRDFFHFLSTMTENDEKKEKIERTKITIIRAILEKSLRRWQFVWNGIKISAPILDFDFYSAFIAHRYEIAPGDALDVDLRIIMRLDEDSGLFLNSEYEVLKVYNHISSPIQFEINES